MRPIAVGLVVPTNQGHRSLIQVTRLARMAGVSSLQVWDHWQDFVPRHLWNREYTWAAKDIPSPHQFLDPFTVLGHLASRAGSMQLGTGVTDILRRHPIALAQWAVTLAHLAKRPPILGLGAGEKENTEPYGLALDQPVGRLQEGLQIIRAGFDSSKPITFAGRFFQLDHAILDLPVPADRKPRIWLGAHGPRMLRLAGTYADGWFPTFAPDPATYEKGRQTIERAAAAIGRELDDFTWSLLGIVVLARSDAEARSVLHKSLATRCIAVMVGSADTWAEVGAQHPLGPEWRGFIDALPESIPEGDLAAALKAVPAEVVEHMMLWGSPPTLVNKIRALADAGLDHVGLLPLSVLVSKRLYRTFGLSLRGIVRALR